jgi:tRNA (cmo5U34)-methyltransferase
MDSVKNHFENEAREFDRIIRTLIPHYATMIRALVGAIPCDKSLPLRVLDLGCGTGTVAESVLEAFPGARLTCLDVAENMIAFARQRLARHSDIEYILADFSEFEFTSRYDVVVSSLALHHLVKDEEKLAVYHRIFRCLNSGGIFYNADVVLGADEFLESVNLLEWRRFMSKEIPEEEIVGKWLPKAEEEDHPSRLMDQLKWLADIGFIHVDVIWKYYGFAIFGGKRP